MKKNSYWIIMAFCFAVFTLNGQKTTLYSIFTPLVKDTCLKNGSIGISIVDVKTGKSLYTYQANKSFTPASVQKLVTTATALELKGPDYTFHTKMYYTGKISGGTLTGDLIITGSGDPSFGSSYIKDKPYDMQQIMKSWYDVLAKNEIKNIDGKIIVDGSCRSSWNISSGWIWEDIGNYYGSAAYGFNYNDNLYKLYFQQNPVEGGKPTVLRTQPALADITFINELVSGSPKSGDRAYIFGDPFSSNRMIRGSIPAGAGEFAVKGALPDPAKVFARVFYDYLTANGAVVTQKYGSNYDPAKYKAGRKEIADASSPPLKELIIQTNFESLNLYADALLLDIADELKSTGLIENTAEKAVDYWRSKGINMGGVFLEDGSGLSPRALITPEALAAVLNYMYSSKYKAHYIHSLATPGVDGTVKNLMKTVSYNDHFNIKSGSMSRVRNYAGYARTQSGRELAFVVMANNYTCTNSVMVTKIIHAISQLYHIK